MKFLIGALLLSSTSAFSAPRVDPTCEELCRRAYGLQSYYDYQLDACDYNRNPQRCERQLERSDLQEAADTGFEGIRQAGRGQDSRICSIYNGRVDRVWVANQARIARMGRDPGPFNCFNRR